MIDLPFEVHMVFNESLGFHKLVQTYRRDLPTTKDAFYAAIDRVREFCEFEKYDSYENYKSDVFKKLYRGVKITGKTKEIPVVIFKAVSSIEGFDEAYDGYFKEYKTKDKAFVKLVRDIIVHFPRYYRYKNATSYLMARDRNIRNRNKK